MWAGQQPLSRSRFRFWGRSTEDLASTWMEPPSNGRWTLALQRGTDRVELIAILTRIRVPGNPTGQKSSWRESWRATLTRMGTKKRGSISLPTLGRSFAHKTGDLCWVLPSVDPGCACGTSTARVPAGRPSISTRMGSHLFAWCSATTWWLTSSSALTLPSRDQKGSDTSRSLVMVKSSDSSLRNRSKSKRRSLLEAQLVGGPIVTQTRRRNRSSSKIHGSMRSDLKKDCSSRKQRTEAWKISPDTTITRRCASTEKLTILSGMYEEGWWRRAVGLHSGRKPSRSLAQQLKSLKGKPWQARCNHPLSYASDLRVLRSWSSGLPPNGPAPAFNHGSQRSLSTTRSIDASSPEMLASICTKPHRWEASLTDSLGPSMVSIFASASTTSSWLARAWIAP